MRESKAALERTQKSNAYPLQDRDGIIRSDARLSQIISPAPRSIWQEILTEDADALATQTPEWMDSLNKAGGYTDASRLYLFEDGQRLLFPLVRKSILFGAATVLSSFPNSWGMGGILSSHDLRVQDVQAVFADLANQKDLRMSIRPNPLKAEIWSAAIPPSAITTPRTAHVLDLDGGFANIWEKKFKSVARTAVRKAEKSDLVVEKDTTGRLVPVFYQLFTQSLARWGTQQHEPLALARLRGSRRDPQEKFAVIAKELGEACQIWVAWKNGEPAATILVLRGKNASYTRGAMNKELAGPVRANDLLHRMAIEDACEAGCRYYHMGETGASVSLANFKSNFGAIPVEYAEIGHEKLPISRAENLIKGAVKKVIGFKDV